MTSLFYRGFFLFFFFSAFDPEDLGSLKFFSTEKPQKEEKQVWITASLFLLPAEPDYL
jgi:hypothetical protein